MFEEIEIPLFKKNVPIEYRLLEFRMILNKELYDEKKISLEVFSEMESFLLGRMKKIENEYSKI